MVILRPSWLLEPKTCQAFPIINEPAGFVIHPSTSELAEQLMVDPESLSNENYSGIYDENGDYVPQYCDNPEDIPQGMITPNDDSSAPPTGASGADIEKATGSESKPDNGDNA